MTRKRSDEQARAAAEGPGRVATAYKRAVEESKERERAHDEAAKYARSSAKYHHTHGSAGHAGDKGSHGRARSRRGAGGLGRVALVVGVVAVVAVGVLFVHALGGGGGSVTGGKLSNPNGQTLASTAADDELPTPIMAQSMGVKLHSAIAMNDLTEILIHNASYSYAEPITTKLKECTNVEVQKKHGTGRNASAQPTGNKWMTGEFIRTYRAGNGGPRMSAIDCGAKEGTQVYSPVSGKVLLVKKYKLYDRYDDYQVHIQPTGHPNLDVVLIHLTDVTAKAGDEVTAGVTPLAKVRDVYALIGESMQLKSYTAVGDNGNHTHIQVNNVEAKNYHGLDDLKDK